MSDRAVRDGSGPTALVTPAWSRILRWTPELRQAVRTLVSVFLSDVVAQVLHLREPYWALITAVIVTQARISSTLEAGRDQIIGTLVGAVAGAGAIALSLAGLPKLPVFAVLLVPLALLAAFKPNLRLAGVTLVVVFLFPAQGGPVQPSGRPRAGDPGGCRGVAGGVLLRVPHPRPPARVQGRLGHARHRGRHPDGGADEAGGDGRGRAAERQEQRGAAGAGGGDQRRPTASASPWSSGTTR